MSRTSHNLCRQGQTMDAPALIADLGSRTALLDERVCAGFPDGPTLAPSPADTRPPRNGNRPNRLHGRSFIRRYQMCNRHQGETE